MRAEHGIPTAAILGAFLWTIGPASARAGPPARLVADIRQAEVEQASSEPADFVVLGDDIYFTAFEDLHGRELWRSDGTAEGTRRVKDICPGPTTESTAGGSGRATAARRERSSSSRR